MKTDKSNENVVKFKQKRKFIKNIRPDAFRRPSSYSMSEADAIKSKDPKPDCTLVGYRKKDLTENSTMDATSVNSVVLGTFTPLPVLDDDGKPLCSSASLPSLFVRSSWSRTSINSLPELRDRHSSPSDSRKAIKSELFTSELRNIEAGLRSKRSKHRSAGLPVKSWSIDNSCSSPQIHEVSVTDLHLDDAAIVEKLGLNENCELSDGKKSLDLFRDAGKDSNVDENWYVNSNLEADEDLSDDETHVANGYDPELEKRTMANSGNVRTLDSDPSTSAAVSRGAVQDLSAEGAGGSTPSLSKDSGIIIQGSEESDSGGDEKITIVEFLKQEYGKISNKTNLGVLQSQGTQDVKEMSHHRAASDTNLFTGVESSSSSGSVHTLVCDTHSNHSVKGGVMSSHSFPELAKYTDNDRPLLVTQVAHSTLR